jgi:hypothetical protein
MKKISQLPIMLGMKCSLRSSPGESDKKKRKSVEAGTFENDEWDEEAAETEPIQLVEEAEAETCWTRVLFCISGRGFFCAGARFARSFVILLVVIGGVVGLLLAFGGGGGNGSRDLPATAAQHNRSRRWYP